MPVGVIVDALSVLLGGLAGAQIGKNLNRKTTDTVNMVLGLCSMGMGIASIVLMKDMPAVVLALILGTLIGILVHLTEHVNQAGALMQKVMHSQTGSSDDLLTAIVLFCASGTGIYGALVSGMSGDHSILIAKAILDFFTALIFAASIGKSVSLIALPQFVILFLLYLLAGVILPYTNDVMIADFKACGGFIMLATGMRMLKLKQFPIADMIPAMILVMPFSALWVQIISLIG